MALLCAMLSFSWRRRVGDRTVLGLGCRHGREPGQLFAKVWSGGVPGSWLTPGFLQLFHELSGNRLKVFKHTLEFSSRNHLRHALLSMRISAHSLVGDCWVSTRDLSSFAAVLFECLRGLIFSWLHTQCVEGVSAFEEA